MLGAAGCAGAGSERGAGAAGGEPRAARFEGHRDDALSAGRAYWRGAERHALAALPDGAARCGLARPWRLPPDRRTPAGFHLAVRGGTWLEPAGVGLAAWAERVDVRSGRRAEVLVLVGKRGADLPAALDAHADVTLRWVRRGPERSSAPGAARTAPAPSASATACEGPDCAWTEARAEQLGDASVRLHVGRWPADAARAGGSDRCAALAEREVEAIEVQVTLGPSADAVVEERVVRAVPSGLLLELRRACVDDEAARRELRRVEGAFAALRDGAWRVARVVRSGSSVTARLTLDWEDVALLDADRRRLAEATAYDAAQRRPLGPDDFDLRDPEALAAQALLHDRAVASATSPGARRASAQAFARLLRAAVDAGASAVYGERLVRLHLDELDDPAGAASLARALAARDEAPVARLRTLEREALARHDRAALEAALVRDGLATRDGAGAAAEALATTIGAGVPASIAEGALLAAQSLAVLVDARRAAVRAAGGALRGVARDGGSRRPDGSAPGAREAVAREPLAAPVALPLAGLPAALDALAALSSHDPWNARATHLLLFAEPAAASVSAARGRGTPPAPPRAGTAVLPDAGQVAVASVVGPNAAPAALLSGRSDDRVLRRVTAGRLLAAGAPTGRVACLYVTTALPGPSPPPGLLPAAGAPPRRGASALAPLLVFALAGEVRDGVLHVDAVGANLAGVDWDALARALAAPLASLEVRLFPPPEARVTLRSPEEAARAARNVVEADVRADGATLRLRAATVSELGAALVELAAPLVGRALPLDSEAAAATPPRPAAAPTRAPRRPAGP